MIATLLKEPFFNLVCKAWPSWIKNFLPSIAPTFHFQSSSRVSAIVFPFITWDTSTSSIVYWQANLIFCLLRRKISFDRIETIIETFTFSQLLLFSAISIIYAFQIIQQFNSIFNLLDYILDYQYWQDFINCSFH